MNFCLRCIQVEMNDPTWPSCAQLCLAGLGTPECSSQSGGDKPSLCPGGAGGTVNTRVLSFPSRAFHDQRRTAFTEAVLYEILLIFQQQGRDSNSGESPACSALPVQGMETMPGTEPTFLVLVSDSSDFLQRALPSSA